MPTTNQLAHNSRRNQRRRTKTLLLEGHAQRRGVIVWSGIYKPKKPNSAQRKVCKVRLSSGKVVAAMIGGEGHTLTEHSIVLIRGGRVPDLPGVRYHVVRGPLDAGSPTDVEPCKGKSFDGRRRQARSKYGQTRPT